jgi:outer membrane protein OmpA-like peptidoglycan-associated protein
VASTIRRIFDRRRKNQRSAGASQRRCEEKQRGYDLREIALHEPSIYHPLVLKTICDLRCDLTFPTDIRSLYRLRECTAALRLSCLGVMVGVLSMTHAAYAIPFGQRLSVRGEVLLSHVVGEPNTRFFGFGAFGALRVGLTIAGPVSIQLSGATGVFPPLSSRDALGVSQTSTWTGGLRFEPRTVRPEGRLFVDVNAGLSATGTATLRFGFDLGLGWELAVSRYLYVGPVLRYWHIYQPDGITMTAEGDADAHYVSLGVNLFLRPFPPPRSRSGTLLAINPDAEPDTDFDGVPDPADQCVTVVEDHDGYQDEDGCPDLDDDADNFPDSEDRCPRQAETPNNFEDEDGCPDALPASRETVTLDGGYLRTRQRVYFAVDRAQIPNYVMGSLRAVARHLNEHPELRHVRVEAHADDRGTRRHGFELSLRRAIAIVNFLSEQGVDRERLDPIGLGDLRPSEEPHDEVTRARNRRVEFAIVDQAPAPPPGHWDAASHPITDLPTPR